MIQRIQCVSMVSRKRSLFWGGTGNGDWWADQAASYDRTTFGSRQGLSDAEYFKGDIAELIVYDGVSLSLEDKMAVEQYLSDKWGIAIG